MRLDVMLRNDLASIFEPSIYAIVGYSLGCRSVNMRAYLEEWDYDIYRSRENRYTQEEVEYKRYERYATTIRYEGNLTNRSSPSRQGWHIIEGVSLVPLFMSLVEIMRIGSTDISTEVQTKGRK